MAKQSFSIKDTNIAQGDAVGKQVEQIVSVDDNILPSPQELAEYKKVNPKIVEMLINAAEREQTHRHQMDEHKMKIISYNEHKTEQANWWGMCFAFLSIVVTMGLAAYALYLDRPWFAGIMGLTAVASIASIFIKKP